MLDNPHIAVVEGGGNQIARRLPVFLRQQGGGAKLIQHGLNRLPVRILRKHVVNIGRQLPAHLSALLFRQPAYHIVYIAVNQMIHGVPLLPHKLLQGWPASVPTHEAARP
ncbi:hypothetical protein SDC9_204359 [bioreactor metagenome]|uniref:Uncharacterized protein n=1 Tax=bioreactor metagenome TaxID=1076179 RepID=A0A645J1T4_9ZZZZ